MGWALILCAVLLCCCAMRPGARSRERDASHRRQHCCASIQDRAYCGFKLDLVACRPRWVGRWDDGLGALLLLRRCELCVVAVVVAVVLFWLVFMYVCLRVLVCSVIVEARRSVTRAGCRHRRQHCCAIIEKLACSGFNLHLAAYRSWVERRNDGRESCAVLLCCAVLCCRSCCLCMRPPRSAKTLFYCQKLLQDHTNKY